MSDYTKTTDFAAKDGYASGNPSKAVVGTEIDDEYNNIATHMATKYDSADLADTVTAQALADAGTLITPSTLNDVLIDNDGLLKQLHDFASTPVTDGLLAWDASAAADSELVYFTAGTNLQFNGTTIEAPTATLEAALNHDNLVGFVADEHIAHSGVSIIAGSGLTGGGAIDASRTLNIGAGSGITVAADSISLTNQAATASNPIDLTSGVFSFDIDGLTTIQGNALAATDTFIVSDGAVDKGIEVQDMGFRVQSAQGSQTLAVSDMNSIMEFDAAATVTIPANATTALPIGAAVIIVVDHASAQVTVTAAASVVLNSTFHPGGLTAGSDNVRAGGTAVLLKTATNEWYLSGDTVT